MMCQKQEWGKGCLSLLIHVYHELDCHWLLLTKKAEWRRVLDADWLLVENQEWRHSGRKWKFRTQKFTCLDQSWHTVIHDFKNFSNPNFSMCRPKIWTHYNPWQSQNRSRATYRPRIDLGPVPFDLESKSRIWIFPPPNPPPSDQKFTRWKIATYYSPWLGKSDMAKNLNTL